MPRRFLISSEHNGAELPHPNCSPLKKGSTVILGAEETKHISQVLRLKPGDLIEGIEKGSSQAYLCELTSVGREGSAAIVREELTTEKLPRVTLLVGMPKHSTADFIAEKAVEIGADEIHFFFAERSQSHLAAPKVEERERRLERITVAASKQSKRHSIPIVKIHLSLEAALQFLHSPTKPQREMRFLCSLPPASIEEAETNAERYVQLEKIGQDVDSYVVIGPEGGLTENEERKAEDFEYSSLSLGPNVLRTETAVILSIGLIRYFQGQ